MPDVCRYCAARKTPGGAFDLQCVVCCASYFAMATKDVNILNRHFCLIDTTPGVPSIESIFEALKAKATPQKFDFIQRHWLIYINRNRKLI